MKLRNKHTGEVKEFNEIFLTTIVKETNTATSEYVERSYSKIDELNADWEDYKPTEPLIKDEKTRKAVRAWAEANGIERVWHECATCWLRGNGLSIEMENEIDELEQGNYAIAELCGEEDDE